MANETPEPRHGNEPSSSDYEPDFDLPRYGAIREDNWPEYAAKGFVPVAGDVTYVQSIYGGAEHVYTGDAFSYAEGRPLRHKPGVTVYVDPEGQRIAEESLREWQEWLREHGSAQESEGGPGSN